MKTMLRVSAGATVLIIIWMLSIGAHNPGMISDLRYWLGIVLAILFFYLLLFLSHVEDL